MMNRLPGKLASALCVACLAMCPCMGAMGQPQAQRPADLELIDQLAEASAQELVAVLSEPDVVIEIPNETAAGYSRLSLWEHAVEHLSQRMDDDTRPLLLAMLQSDAAYIRNNALRVALASDAEVLAPLAPALIPLLDDPQQQTRVATLQVLFRFKTQATESALLATLDQLDIQDYEQSDAVREIGTLLLAIGHAPIDEQAVFDALLPWIDEARYGTRITRSAIEATSELSQSDRFGPALIDRYWDALGATEEGYLADRIRGVMRDDDARTYPYLLRCQTIPHPQARLYAAVELIDHEMFDPQAQMALINALLEDEDPGVRINTLRSFHANHTQAYGNTEMLDLCFELLDRDDDARVKTWALATVVDLLRSDRELINDESQRHIPGRVLAYLDDEALRQAVIYQTSRLLGQSWDSDTSEAAVERTRAYWRSLAANAPG